MKCVGYFVLTAILTLAFCTNARAQDDYDGVRIERVKDRKQDNFVLEFTNDMWLDTPADVDLRVLSVGFKGYFFVDHNFGEGIFSFAWGLGISSDNVHSNAVPVREVNEEGKPGNQVLTAFPDEYDYDKNKFVTTYLELPLELRIITRGRSPFKLAAGFRLGYLLADHQKIIDGYGKRKYYDFAHITNWRYGLSARIGVGKFGLTGFYSLTPLIEEGKGTQVIPVSVGISFIPL